MRSGMAVATGLLVLSFLGCTTMGGSDPFVEHVKALSNWDLQDLHTTLSKEVGSARSTVTYVTTPPEMMGFQAGRADMLDMQLSIVESEMAARGLAPSRSFFK